MSQAELAGKLAEQLGKDRVDPTSITRLERGTRTITVNELVALAQIFGVREEVLLAPPDAGAVGELARVFEAYKAVQVARSRFGDGYREWASAQADLRIALAKVDLEGVEWLNRNLIEYAAGQSAASITNARTREW